MHEPQSQGICVRACAPLPSPAKIHPPRKEQAWQLPRQILRRHPWPHHKIQTVQHLRMREQVSAESASKRNGQLPTCCLMALA